MLAASFEIHPYRNNTIGWLSDVEALTRDEAYAFYRRYYQPNNAVLVVAGDATTEEVLAKVKERFGRLPGSGDTTAVRAIEPEASGSKRITLKHPGPEAQVLIAFRAPSLSDADFPALVLFDALLAGGRGFAGSVLRSAGHGGPYPQAAGTLLDEATAGLARGARTDWQVSTYPYVYTLTATVAKADGLGPAEAALFQALDAATAKAWTDADIRRALHQVKTAVALDLDDQRGRVHQMALFEVAGGYSHLESLPDQVARVTLEEVRRFAKERLGPDRATVGWFEPRETASEAKHGSALPTALTLGPTSPPTPAVSTAAAPAVTPPSSKTASPSRTTLRLPSGLVAVVQVQSGSSLASLHGRLEVGSARDGAVPGLAALAVAALSEPLADETQDAPTLTWTPRRDAVAAVSLHAIEVTASVLPEDLPRVLDSLGRRLRRPPPAGRAFENLRADAARHADEQNASAPGQLLARALRELFPSSSALSRPPWSDAQSLSRIDAGTFAAFWKGQVTPAGLRLAVAGNLEVGAVRTAVESAFKDAPALAPPPPSALPGPRGADDWKEVRMVVPDLLQDELLVVWPGDRSRPLDAPATRALLYLLGETGYAGRLADVLVEPGLVYSVETSLEGEGASSWLAVRTACDAKDTAEVSSRIRKTLERAASGTFTDAERREALAYLRGKAARRREGSANAAQALLHEAAPEPGELTLAALNDAARRMFAKGFPVILVARRPVAAQ